MDSDTFIVRRRSNLQALPDWLKGRRYNASLYGDRRRRDRIIALHDGAEPSGLVVCMNEKLFPEALIAVLHAQGTSQ